MIHTMAVVGIPIRIAMKIPIPTSITSIAPMITSQSMILFISFMVSGFSGRYCFLCSLLCVFKLVRLKSSSLRKPPIQGSFSQGEQ